MPERTYMGIDERGDHRFGIPDPVTARAVGSRNVCADCHGTDQSVESILKGPESRPGLAIEALRAMTTDRMALLREVLVDSTVSRIEKGSLIARLGTEPTTDGLRIVMTALSSGNPFERVGALRAIADPAFRAPLPNLDDRFADSLRWVRVEAVATALAHGYDDFDEEPARSALAEYEEAQWAVAEQPEAHLNLAMMREITERMDQADLAFDRAGRLAPEAPDIAIAHGLMLGRWANRVGRASERGPGGDYRSLRRRGEEKLAQAVMLQQESGTAAGTSQALATLGLYLGEERPRLPAAAAALDQAWRLDETNQRALLNAAISWHQMGDMDKAEERYRAGADRHPALLEFQDGLVVLLMQTDRWEEASALNLQLIQSLPDQTRWQERQALIDSQRAQGSRQPQDS